MIAEKIQIDGIKITGFYICELKKLICSFLFMLPSKNEYYGGEKMTKIKLAMILVPSFDKFHPSFNLYIFGLCFVVL